MKESRLNSTVVFQNADFVVVSKPAGLNFHSEESPGLVVLVKQALGVEVLYPVHRLDKMTSGLVIFALNKKRRKPFR
ncbi:MAG: pseudouridine synthase [Thiomicrorhabdus sp.]|nr:pseudouridine synthase [Thiomicrorhabdus sp.]